MNIPHEIVSVAVKPVIVIVPALIGTKFLIGSSMDFFSTVETFSFHSTENSHKDIKTIYKESVYLIDFDVQNRLQTAANDYK